MKVSKTKAPEKFMPYTISIQVETDQEEGDLKSLFFSLDSFIEERGLSYESKWEVKEQLLFKKIHKIVVED